MDDLRRIHQFLTHRSGVDPTQLHIQALAGDVSSRRYYRAKSMGGEPEIITLYPAPFECGAPALEQLLTLEQERPDAGLSYANNPVAQLEMSAFLEAHGMPVPALRGHDGKLGVVAFEDLGDERLVEALQEEDEAGQEAWYVAAVELIVGLQRLTSAFLDSGQVGTYLCFHQQKLMWEMNFFLEHYFNSYLEIRLNRTQLEDIVSELNPLCSWLAHRPRVLCHRDYHARNLMVVRGQLYLIDYQDARLGPMTYDLVSLLLDPYAPSPPTRIERLRKRFCLSSHLHDNGGFMREWHAMSAQRLLKAAGTYAFQTAVRGRTDFEGYLGPTLEQAREALKDWGGAPTLVSFLGER